MNVSKVNIMRDNRADTLQLVMRQSGRMHMLLSNTAANLVKRQRTSGTATTRVKTKVALISNSDQSIHSNRWQNHLPVSASRPLLTKVLSRLALRTS